MCVSRFSHSTHTLDVYGPYPAHLYHANTTNTKRLHEVNYQGTSFIGLARTVYIHRTYTVYLVISLPKKPYINRIYMVLANPSHSTSKTHTHTPAAAARSSSWSTSQTVSARPPVRRTTGTVPNCMAIIWVKPQGSKMDGTCTHFALQSARLNGLKNGNHLN